VELPPSARDLTDDEWELIELARATIDANTDADPEEDGVHTMGAAVRAACGRDRQVADLMPLAAVWTVEGGTQPYNPAIFLDPPSR
jgi:hypothetical protein